MSERLIQHIEELAANAWPAAVVQVVDGWRLRFTQGVTRRANSVWPNAAGGQHTTDVKIALVEEVYTRWGSPARFQICPAARPPELDEILAARGYSTDAETAVRTTALATVLGCSEGSPAHEVIISENLDETWFAAYCSAEAVREHAATMRRGILQRIRSRTGFARLHHEGETIAVGFGVLERGWVGIFSMTTRPEYRRRGAATAILRALAEWGQTHGAESGYLQVMIDNTAAHALYANAGFKTLYHYHYRELLPT